MSEPCALWCLLMKKFAIGKLSAVEVQQLAAAAVKSGATSAEMRELQSLGSHGHLSRELVQGYAAKIFSGPGSSCAMEDYLLHDAQAGWRGSQLDSRLPPVAPPPVGPVVPGRSR